MIDSEKIKLFWETRSKKWGKLPFESIANLEDNPQLLQLKIRLEQDKILPLLSLNSESQVLDLGAGVGQWSFRFSNIAQHVTAVEYMNSFTKIASEEAIKRGVKNIKFINSAAESFISDQTFDVIFISGLYVFLNPDQAKKLMDNLPKFLKNNGKLLLRDGTSILDTSYQINNRYSTILNEYYSAFYRTRSEYLKLFEKDFHLIQDGQMFEDGSPLNKFPETRLWYYLFNKKHQE